MQAEKFNTYKITYKWAEKNNAYRRNWNTTYGFYPAITTRTAKKLCRDSFNKNVEVKILEIEKVSI